MKKTFFDALNVAAMETAQSAILAWILSDDCDAYDLAQRSQMLCELFGLHPSGAFDWIQGSPEIDRQDIIYLAALTNELLCLVIENKVKSEQSPQQLEKNRKKLKDTIATLGLPPNVTPSYRFLTLIDELPEDAEWKSIHYRDVLAVLEKAPFKEPQGEEAVIARGYIESVRRLVGVVDDFLHDHTRYPNVFKEGSLSKAEKRRNTRNGAYLPHQQYVCDNQLETILQKAILASIWKQMKQEDYPYEIKETHGTALLQADLHTGLRINGRTFKICIQYQGASVKINLQIQGKCEKSESNWIPLEAKNVLAQLATRTPFTRANLTTKKAYISISRNSGKHFWEKSQDEIVKSFNADFDSALPIAKEMAAMIQAKCQA